MSVATQKSIIPPRRKPIVNHGPDLDNLILPALRPGPYVSSSSEMGDDDLEVLHEAPEHMKRKRVFIEIGDSDEEEEAGGGRRNAVAGPSRPAAGRRESLSRAKEDLPVGHSARRKHNYATMLGGIGEEAEPPRDASAPLRNTKRARFEVLIPHEEVDGPATAGPSRARQSWRDAVPAVELALAREPTMSIAFGNEPAMEVPLGWGGLGIPDRAELPAVAPARPPPIGDPRLVRPPDMPPLDPIPPPAAAPAGPEPASAPRSIRPKLPADYLPAIREVIPDICPSWALLHLTAHVTAGSLDPAAQVIQAAFEVDGGYPTAQKAATSASVNVAKKVEEDYRSVEYKKEDRRGAVYDEKAQSLLNELLPMVPMPHVRAGFRTKSSLLVPAYFALDAEYKLVDKPYVPLKVGRNTKGKGRALLFEPYMDAPEGTPDDNLFIAQRMKDGRTAYDHERRWLAEYIRKEAEENDLAKAKEMAREEALANGGGMECGCCFTDELLENMFQCSEGHLFCRECTTMHIETKLGEQKHVIACMDTSSCPALFPESELTRVLSDKSLHLYHRLKQASELESAGLVGLETCPQCPYSAIIENPDEKLFRCQAPDCGVVSCRKCRRIEHLPKTCEEMEADRKLDKRHEVEDAMSAALIRNCPKCEKPFIKDAGCNKITCAQCQTISCYVCRKVVTNGYAHFDQNPAAYGQPRDSSKCLLWDHQGHHDAGAILAARDAAQAEARIAAAAEGVQLAEADINVDAPAAVPQVPGHPHHIHPAPAFFGVADHAALMAHVEFLRAGRRVVPPGANAAQIEDINIRNQAIDRMIAAGVRHAEQVALADAAHEQAIARVRAAAHPARPRHPLLQPIQAQPEPPRRPDPEALQYRHRSEAIRAAARAIAPNAPNVPLPMPVVPPGPEPAARPRVAKRK